MTNLIIFGPPGSGKGTISRNLSKINNISHISTGDLLRENVAKATEIGIKAKIYVDKGEYVPDHIATLLLERTLPEYIAGFILDGYPRTIQQTHSLKTMLKKIRVQIDLVFNLNVSEAEIITRLSNRRVCNKCRSIYNLVSNPPKTNNICDKCEGEIVQRADDHPDVILNRLKVYSKNSKPVLDFYRAESKLVEIDGLGDVDTVASRVNNVMRKL